jgi:very-short-patch-repair endonuclease
MSRPLDERLFVKNIENVQGDERDIIVFSTGYGPGVDGRVRLQFGSLSNQGGENRLNVAVTRARKQIHVFSSVNPDEIDVSTTRNEGPKYLKWYLQYAKAVSDSNSKEADRHLKEFSGGPHTPSAPGGRLIFDSVFEEEVQQALTERGLLVDTQVGASGYRIDLAIRHPQSKDRYVLGVECDGASFHSAKSVRERDVYRQRYLESRGWNIARIWSRNWWRNRSKEVDRIQDLVRELT